MGANDAKTAGIVGSAITNIAFAGHIVKVQPATVLRLHDAFGAQDHAVFFLVRQLVESVAQHILRETLGGFYADVAEYFVSVMAVMMVPAAAGMTIVMMLMLVVVVVAMAFFTVLMVVMLVVVAVAFFTVLMVVMLVVVVVAMAFFTVFMMVVMLVFMLVAVAFFTMLMVVMMLHIVHGE